MYSNSDISSVYSLLTTTGEGNLKKMLVDSSMTEPHLRLLIKIAKSAPEANFVECFISESFGSLKTNPAENKMKETFWPICKKRLSALGFLGLTAKAA